MKKATAIGLVLVFAVSAAAEEQWLQYRTAKDPSRSGVSVLWQTLEDDAPSGVALPGAVKSEAWFARWKTPLAPDGFVRVAVFAAAGRGSCDRALVDADVDGSLADETILTPGRSMGSQRVFEGVKVVFPGSDGAVTYHLNLMISQRGDKPSVRAAAACWYEGTVKIAGRDHMCRLIDYNGNGAFDDALGGAGGDQVGIGQPSGKDYSQMALGKYIAAAGALYEVSPARDGAFVEFVEAKDVPAGTLVVPEAVTRLVVAGPLGQLDLSPSGGRASVPAGAWRVLSWRMDKTDKTGAWTLSGGASSKAQPVEVAAGGETKVDVGEPVTGSLAVTKSGKSYSFSQAIVGSLGEQVQLLRSGGLAPAPKVRIRNADASYDRTFSFSYG